MQLMKLGETWNLREITIARTHGIVVFDNKPHPNDVHYFTPTAHKGQQFSNTNQDGLLSNTTTPRVLAFITHAKFNVKYVLF